MDYLVTNEVRISKATEHIGKKDCFNLNSQYCIVKKGEPGRHMKNGITMLLFSECLLWKDISLC
ncbi:hypothetical protein DXA36_20655 [Eisenbergiella sp. OF01-20]|nr:hypothetical protein DXA36_20655 [Eisenbergiella sp. OF01-20]